MPLGIGVEQVTGGGDRHFLADAGDDVLQRPPLGGMIMDVVGRQDGAAMRSRQPVEPLDPRIVAAAIKPARRDVAERRQCFLQPRQFALERVEILAGPGDERNALGMAGDVLQRQVAFALFRPHLAEAEQPRQPAITVAVLWDRAEAALGASLPQSRAGSRSAASTPRPCTRCACAPRRPACCGRRPRSHPCRARAPGAPARSRPTPRAGTRRASTRQARHRALGGPVATACRRAAPA